MSDEDIAREFGAKVITKAHWLDSIPVTKYQTKTGMHVIIADVDGPMVSTFLCLATEAHDDDGLPHTLEHLIFLGSEKYPYKGLLDLLANKCLASGTNAWTDTDHTAYTLETTGAEGTLALLPIYLDHVLYPVLTDHGFVTEVYHISGEGQDAGVVYCEMQGIENRGERRTDRASVKALYKDTGYDSETGGIMFNLRTSTNNEKIRAFHAEFYRPDNLTIIIVGSVTAKEVFKAISPFEEKILSKPKLPPYVRPWQSVVPPFNKKQILNIKYPTDNEDCGMVEISWLGPNITGSEGMKDLIPSVILLRYLSETPIAPLQKLLVEVKDPFANDVGCGVTENSTSRLSFTFQNVPVEKLQDVLPIVVKEIEDTVDGKVQIDIVRIQRIIRKQLREALLAMETEPHQSVAFKCITDMLYSQTNEQLESRLNQDKILKTLLDKDEEWWRSILKKYFGDNYVAVVSTPSIDLMMELADEEKQRVESRIEELGKQGLEEKAKILAEAMAYNSREVPSEILKSLNNADSTKIRFHSLQSWTTGDDCPYVDLKNMPFYTKVNSLKTNFVYTTLIINSNLLNADQRRYLPMLLEVLCQSPIKRGDAIIPYETVLSEIEDVFVQFDISIGFSKSGYFSLGKYHELIFASANFEPEKYEEVVKLLSEIILFSIFTKDRVSVVVQKMINDVASYRRSGQKICMDLLKDMTYSQNSNVHASGALRQYTFLNDLLKKLDDDDNSANEVLAEMEEIRKILTAPGNMWLHMAANLEKHPLKAEPWTVFGTNSGSEGFTFDDYTLMRPVEERQGKGYVVGVGGVESCFLTQACPGPLNWKHPDLPALEVVLSYFTQLEGPMWRIIRGGGFSYGYGINTSPLEGVLKLRLTKATNAPAAYKETVKILKNFLDKPEWDEELFGSAKTSLISQYVNTEKTPDMVVNLSLSSYLNHVDYEFNRNFIKAINNVTMEEALEVAKKWLPGLYEPKVSVLSVVSHPSKIEEIHNEFIKLGFNLEATKSPEASPLNAA